MGDETTVRREPRKRQYRRRDAVSITYVQLPGTPEEEAALIDVLSEFLPEYADADASSDPRPAA
jgi:hypothetical protein